MPERRSHRRAPLPRLLALLVLPTTVTGFAATSAAVGHAVEPVVSVVAYGEPAAAKASKLTLAVAQPSPGTAVLAGRLTTADGRPISGPVLLAVDGRPVATVTSGGDGGYTAQVAGVPAGNHLASATFPGSSGAAPAGVTAVFTVAAPEQPKAPATTAPAPKAPTTAPPPKAPTTAPATPAAPAAPATAPAAGNATVLTVKVDPGTATPGSLVTASGTLLSAANRPVDQARIEVATSWGDATAVSSTDAAGAFTVALSLPALPAGQAPPPTMTVTVSYAGDGPYAASKGTATVALAPAPPPPPPPVIKSETPGPPASKEPAFASVPPRPPAPMIDVSSAASRGVAVLVFVLAVGAVTMLAGMGAVAWRRNQLLPGERRGFGSDFGK